MYQSTKHFCKPNHLWPQVKNAQEQFEKQLLNFRGPNPITHPWGAQVWPWCPHCITPDVMGHPTVPFLFPSRLPLSWWCDGDLPTISGRWFLCCGRSLLIHWDAHCHKDKNPLRSLSGESLEKSTWVLLDLDFSASGCVATIMLLSSRVMFCTFWKTYCRKATVNWCRLFGVVAKIHITYKCGHFNAIKDSVHQCQCRLAPRPMFICAFYFLLPTSVCVVKWVQWWVWMCNVEAEGKLYLLLQRCALIWLVWGRHKFKTVSEVSRISV